VSQKKSIKEKGRGPVEKKRNVRSLGFPFARLWGKEKRTGRSKRGKILRRQLKKGRKQEDLIEKTEPIWGEGASENTSTRDCKIFTRNGREERGKQG